MKRLTKNTDILHAKPEDYFNDPKEIKRVKYLQKNLLLNMDKLEAYKKESGYKATLVESIQWNIDYYTSLLELAFRQ